MKNKYRLLLIAVLSSALLFGCAQNEDSQEEGMQTEAETEVETEADDGDTPETDAEETGIEIEAEAGEAVPEETTAASELATPIRIWGVVTDTYDGVIVVDNQSDVSSAGEIELTIGEETYVLDASTGLPVSLDEVETGSFEAYLGPEMMMSLPPQTTPYVVIVNIPEDSRTPQYAIAAELTEENDGNLSLIATDGRIYRIPHSARITPYLTKNIVTRDDIRVGTACLIWADDDDEAQTVMIFPE
ncbi:MAG: hypothetical protein LUE31_10740 [Lachnospiraceae bacterium]|nr:hypothetical protein [Lachnospiraceae bacterium]